MRRFRILSILVVLFVIQSGCSLSISRIADAPATVVATTATQAGQVATPYPSATARAVDTSTSSRISLDLLKNFTYWVKDFNVEAALKDGVYSDDKIRVQLIESKAFGDLNADGLADAVVILAIKSGGTGTFFDLIAVLDQNGTAVQAAFSYIGDRQGINDLKIVNGRVILDYFTQGLKDPLCCPSERRLRTYLFEKNALLLASEQILDSPTGQATPLPDIIMIDQPAMYDRLTTPLQVRGRINQVPPERKLVYTVTDINATLLMQGEVAVEGEPGRPGIFSFEFALEAGSPGLIRVEVVDVTNGIVRGRSLVVLVTQ